MTHGCVQSTLNDIMNDYYFIKVSLKICFYSCLHPSICIKVPRSPTVTLDHFIHSFRWRPMPSFFVLFYYPLHSNLQSCSPCTGMFANNIANLLTCPFKYLLFPSSSIQSFSHKCLLFFGVYWRAAVWANMTNLLSHGRAVHMPACTNMPQTLLAEVKVFLSPKFHYFKPLIAD